MTFLCNVLTITVISDKNIHSKPCLYLCDHGQVNKEADDAADGSNYFSSQCGKGRFRRQHVHESCYQAFHPYELRSREDRRKVHENLVDNTVA